MIKEFIKACNVEDNIIKLPSPKDFKADAKTYGAVKKIFLGWGGSYKKNAFVFKDNPQKFIDEYLGEGRVNNIKKDFQFFETPQAVVDKVMYSADIEDHHSVLEPSAGRGALLKELSGVTHLSLVELNPDNRAYLMEQGFTVAGDDFLAYHPRKKFDRIIMNPPFTKNQDVKHILHAYSMLADGGRLVAIASAGVTFKENKLCQQVRDLALDIEELPADSFKESGTKVNTVMITIDK